MASLEPQKPAISILIATRDVAYARTVARFIEPYGYATRHVQELSTLLRDAGRRRFDAILLDLELTRQSDLQLITFILRRSPHTQIILLFDASDVAAAIEGLHLGAYLYIPKSCQPSDVAAIVDNALRAVEFQSTGPVYDKDLVEQMAGGSPAMKRVIEIITKVAPTDSTVLLLGESGTGKEVLANTIHRLSPRREKAFIAVNCAALPEQLLESELFGHLKGSFTGAEADKLGLFEEADGGTIFLDEIGDTSPAMQAKLLRVLQNGEVRRVGDTQSHRVDVRVLAASNKDLVDAVAKKEFREDLYFRLNVIQIYIPPLRDRLDALPGLVNQFLKRYNQKYQRNVANIDEHAWRLLEHYEFPGNIRELESILAHAVILSEGDTIHAEDLPDQVRFGHKPRLALPNLTSTMANNGESARLPTLHEMERRLIEQALVQLNGNQTEVAKQMGISRSTLWRKMKEYGLSRTE